MLKPGSPIFEVSRGREFPQPDFGCWLHVAPSRIKPDTVFTLGRAAVLLNETQDEFAVFLDQPG